VIVPHAHQKVSREEGKTGGKGYEKELKKLRQKKNRGKKIRMTNESNRERSVVQSASRLAEEKIKKK